MRRVLLISVGLLFVTLAVFCRVRTADFVWWDDDISVYRNPHIQGLDWERVRWMFSDAKYAMRYKPLTWLAYAILYQFFGLNPQPYHLANLVLHGCNAVLVFLVVRRLLGAAAPLASTDWPAAAAALLWALNPLRVEPVARVTDLTFCLQFFFVLISLWCYLRWCGPGQAPQHWRYYWGSVGAFALAVLAYPFAVAYGAVLLILDWYPLRRFREGARGSWASSARKLLVEKIPFLLLGGMILTTVTARLNPGGIWAGAEMDGSFSLFERMMQAFYVWGYYLWRPLVPAHLSPLYTTLVDFNPNGWPFWLSAILVTGVTLALLAGRKRWPGLLALWGCYLLLLIPVLGLTERPHYTVDRYDYMPGVLEAAGIAGGLCLLSVGSRWRRLGYGGVVSVALLWGAMSYRQTLVWQNSEVLFRHMIGELGNDLNRSDLEWRLAGVLQNEGKAEEAVRYYQASLKDRPNAEAFFALAELLAKRGDRQGALTNCQAALQLHLNPLNRVQAGQVLAQLGRSAEAIEQYRLALASVPDLIPALNNLAWILASDPDAANRNGAEAVRLAEQADALSLHQVPVVLGTLGAAYAEAGRFAEAIQAGQKAAELAEAAGEKEVAERNRELLKLYRAGRAYREGSGGRN